jgi:hypothetical protein
LEYISDKDENVMRFSLWALATLMAATVPALAADMAKFPGSVSVSKDAQVTVRPLSNVRTQSIAVTPTMLPTIVDNLAEKYPDGRYDPYGGSGVWGPNVAGFDSRNWQAVSFTPAADASVAKIELSVKLISGTNRIVLSLRDDNAGLPGALLQSWVLANLESPVTCCKVKAVTPLAAIPVLAGHRYWLALSTDASSQDTFATWSSNVTEPLEEVLLAHNQGAAGWNGFTGRPAPAFAVFASP